MDFSPIIWKTGYRSAASTKAGWAAIMGSLGSKLSLMSAQSTDTRLMGLRSKAKSEHPQ
jgi:hypothetical protein